VLSVHALEKLAVCSREFVNKEFGVVATFACSDLKFHLHWKALCIVVKQYHLANEKATADFSMMALTL